MSLHIAEGGAHHDNKRVNGSIPKSVAFEQNLPEGVPETPSTASSSRPASTSRRSVAHQPRLLGFEDVDLLELQARPSPSFLSAPSVASRSLAPPPPPSASASRPRVVRQESAPVSDTDDRFRVDDEEGGSSHDVVKIGNGTIPRYAGESSQSLKPTSAKRSEPLRDGSYADLNDMNQDDQEGGEYATAVSHTNRALGDGYAEVQRGNTSYDDVVEEEDDVRFTLMFEATTAREKMWMWTSCILVGTLTTVSISIAVGWIDWPGDGLGQN